MLSELLSFVSTTMSATVLSPSLCATLTGILLVLGHGLSLLVCHAPALTAELCKLFGARAAVELVLAPS